MADCGDPVDSLQEGSVALGGSQGLAASKSSHQLEECVLHQCLGVDVRLGDFDVVQ